MSDSSKPDPAASKAGKKRKKTSAAPATPPPPAADDVWAEALAEQEAAAADSSDAEPAAPARKAGDDVFRPFDADNGAAGSRELEMIMDIPGRLSVELGRTRLTIKELLELAQGSVVELDGLPGEPMDILINGYLIAQGEVVVVEDRYGIRISEIVTPSTRLQKLNR